MRSWHWLTCLLPVLAFAGAGGIELSLSPETVRPGDRVELRARMERADPAEFEVRLPPHDALHVVACERRPLVYRDGRYVQETVWLLQPLRAGPVEIDGITARIRQAGGTTEVAFDPPRFDVLPHPDGGDDFEPAPLPPPADGGKAAPFAVFGLVVALAAAAAVVFLLRRRARPGGSGAVSQGPSLEDLESELEAGGRPSLLIQRLLESGDTVPPGDLRELLERAAYGRGFDREELLRRISREVRT